jgi:chemotaxis family two-component system response regulator PixG
MTSPQADSWTFYLQQGQIVYATGGIHPVRRWRRNIAIHLPQINIDFLELQKELTSLAKKSFKICWEYDILYPWIGQQKITKEQASQMLLSSLVEILFDITQAIEITCEIVPDRFLSTKLPLINPQQVIN